MTTKPLVAIVGRPNVGKSTFFNKIAGHRVAIVEDTPGVTRDRIYADVEWTGREFTLIDTGGIDPRSDDVLLSQMRRQAEIAIEMADVICFFCDARDGLTRDDDEVASLLRRTRKPVILVVNKLDEIVKLLPPKREDEEEDENGLHEIQLALVGRPNVGKSSLTNRLLGQERVMVSDIPGTTRDAIDTHFESQYGGRYNIIDTAGIRRKRAVEDQSLERYSVLRAIAAIRRCDVALLVIDAVDGVTEQDTKIAGIIPEEGKAVIVVVNKWDIPEKDTGTLEKFRKKVLDDLKFMDYAPVLFISALTGQRVNTVLDAVDQAYAQTSKRIPTGLLNDVLGDAQIALQPPMTGGRRLKVYYGTQISACPPTFALFVNDEALMHFAYQRYLENQLRKAFGFSGTPIRFALRERAKENG